MRLILALLFVLVLAAPAAAGSTAANAQFVPGLEDVPLMPDLVPVDEQTLEFDTPGGRIVESYATGPVAAADVGAFYDRTLPQLGWTRVGPLKYRREAEALMLEIMDAGRPLTVRFRLAPAESSPRQAPPTYAPPAAAPDAR